VAINGKLYLFLFLSVLLHLGLGQLLNSDHSPRLPGSTISISLLPPDNQKMSNISSVQTTGGRPNQRASGQVPQQNAKSDLSIKPDQRSPSSEEGRIQQPENAALTAVNDKSDPSTSQAGRIQALITGSKLKRMLQISMAQYFRYPRFALKRGWQGEVTIGIRIDPNGYISRMRLVNSSGYNTLDLAALEDARRVTSLPNAVALLNGQTFDIQLPVIYRLQDV